jgi:hypothetical protein
MNPMPGRRAVVIQRQAGKDFREHGWDATGEREPVRFVTTCPTGVNAADCATSEGALRELPDGRPSLPVRSPYI